MKLTGKERQALAALRSLDARQRDGLLAQIKRAAIANMVVTKVGQRAGALKRIRTTPDHKIVKAFGTVPRQQPGRIE